MHFHIILVQDYMVEYEKEATFPFCLFALIVEFLFLNHTYEILEVNHSIQTKRLCNLPKNLNIVLIRTNQVTNYKIMVGTKDSFSFILDNVENDICWSDVIVYMYMNE